ncbi:nucleotide sugar dehydrogenase [Alteromonas facilis]|uniref:nucleotide sugar dehydrogenase n=1 Tax=Alteromonas facilis TaxID=2048004 RepID=UPI001F0C14CD|nr:UDP-glucose/GDP-mannose dehydrogenase family protein [Alteromonas facilis]
MIKISVVGMGYVGLVSATCLANDGNKVIGVDNDSSKLNLIKEGRSPIVEKGLAEMLQREVLETANLSVTSDLEEAVEQTDISFICVGTPSNKQGGLDYIYIEQVCEELGKALVQKDAYHLIVIRSTVLPGTLINIVKPIIEKSSGLIAGKDFGLASNPEFLREGTAIHDYQNPPMTVIGALDERSALTLEEVYSDTPCELIQLPIESAELVKYSCNAWHATKVAFANEIGSFAKAFGVDGREVMNVLCKDKVLNISEYYMKPGFAFGGSCLPKDLRALDHEARGQHIQLPLLHAVLESNRKHIYKAVSHIQKIGKTRIGLLGLSFKAGTDDLRESPLVELASILTGKGYDLQIFDPNLNASIGLNSDSQDFSRYIPFPYLLRLLSQNLQDVVDFADLIIIGNPEQDFKSVIENLPPDKQLLDLAGLMTSTSTENLQGICW